MEPREFLDILATAERLKDVTRHSYTSGGRHESVAEHSWRLALMALLLKDRFPQADMNKVISMCLIHDLGEAFTGDIPVFLKEKKDSEIENNAFRQWISSLPEPVSFSFSQLWDEMEALQTTEAKIYKALDKLEALVQHNEADLGTWLDLEYDLQRTYGIEACEFDPYISSIRQLVLQDTEKKIREKMAKKEPKTNAMRILDSGHIKYSVLTYEVDENDLSGDHAAQKLGLDPQRVFKTLVLKGDKNGYIVACIPVGASLDLKLLARCSGNKSVEMVHVKELLGITGYVRGGCSPIGMKKLFPTYIDQAALDYEEIVFSAGQRGVQIVASPNDLMTVVGAQPVHITL